MPKQTQSTDWDRIAEAIDELRHELARLGDRVARLESVGILKPAAASLVSTAEQPVKATAAPAPTAAGGDLEEELVLVLSAAIAAFLGVKPHIRQIQLLGSAAWAQQGRVTIQASHRLTVAHH
jgi:methylmalonyl-CoA carboxyltransferase large subunit